MRKILLLFVSVFALNACSSTGVAKQEIKPTESAAQDYQVVKVEHGKASWYSIKTNRGTKTASGQKLNENAMTAAHKTLPMGTKVRVTNLRNGKSVIVRINDRGPFIKGRVIDVTIGAARELGFVKNGIVSCKVEVLKKN